MKYVDLNSFSYAVLDGRSPIALTFLVSFVIAIAIWAGVALWKSAGGNAPQRSLAWAVAISWTMLVNVYSPIYDSILIVIAIILAISALGELKWLRAREWVVLLAVLMFAIAWVTEPIAKNYGVQLLTLALLAFAMALTYLLQRANRALFVSTQSYRFTDHFVRAISMRLNASVIGRFSRVRSGPFHSHQIPTASNLARWNRGLSPLP